MKKSKCFIILAIVFVAGITWADAAKEWFEKGVSAMEVGYYNVAIKCFEKAIAADPNDSESYLNIGLIHNKKGETKKAISYYKKAIAMDPNFAKAHSQLGIAYSSKGLDSRAADHFYKASLLFLKQGDRKAALKAYERLKLTKSEELEKALFEKLYPKLRQGKSESSK